MTETELAMPKSHSPLGLFVLNAERVTNGNEGSGTTTSLLR